MAKKLGVIADRCRHSRYSCKPNLPWHHQLICDLSVAIWLADIKMP